MFPVCLCQYLESARGLYAYLHLMFALTLSNPLLSWIWLVFIYQVSRLLWFFKNDILDKDSIVRETGIKMGKTFTEEKNSPYSMGIPRICDQNQIKNSWKDIRVGILLFYVCVAFLFNIVF